jgi:DNA-directed RNA polymerase subunit L
MELKLIKEDEKSKLIEVKGESFSFVNLIVEELWKSDKIDEAATIKEHPYMAEPKLYVKVKEKTKPEVELSKAIKGVEAQLKELKKELSNLD